ncbi:MAG: NADH-quinone oxidoreductase subunit NuoN [Pseudomonadota bacterium]
MLDWIAIVETLAPELWLVSVGLLGTFAGALVGQRSARIFFKLGAMALFIAAGLAYFHLPGGEAFGGLVVSNPFVNFAKIVSFGLAGVALWIADGFFDRHETLRFEYALLMVFACLGMGITLSAADLMTLYMGVETLSLTSYVLASFHRDSPRSAEAGLKYFVLGALASGLLLYGASLVYGFSGSTSYAAIAEADMGTGMLFGMVLMITGLGFKVSEAPMHVWTPDVYEGSPTPVGAFFSAAPKMAMMVVFANVLFTVFGNAVDDWQLVLAIIAGASMVIGSFGALLQNNIKRLLGYSSIANMGYALVPVAAGADLGAPALLMFMTIYTIASLGMFAGVLMMRRTGGMVEDISELGGLFTNRPIVTLALTAILLSIAGIPPLAGFWAKYAVVEAGLAAGLLPLVILLVIASVVSAAYYLRIIKVMWFDAPKPDFQSPDPSVVATVVACGFLMFPVLLIGIGILGGWTEAAAMGLTN